MSGGPEWRKACAMTDGKVNKRFRNYWRAWRRLKRSPKATEWEGKR